jgi:putative transposase
MMLDRSAMYYKSRRDPQDPLRVRLRELAASRVRFGYRPADDNAAPRRLAGERQTHLPLVYGRWAGGADQGAQEDRAACTRTGAECNATQRKMVNGFVAARLLDGRWFRVLTVVDQFTRECLLLLADSSLTGQKEALVRSLVVTERGAPASIPVDNGSEFYSRAMEAWAYQYGVQLDFIRPGKPVENSYIESFNGRLRDECLNVQVFFALADVRDKLERWRQDYNQVRPHSALHDSALAMFAAHWTETAAPRPEKNPEGREKAAPSDLSELPS